MTKLTNSYTFRAVSSEAFVKLESSSAATRETRAAARAGDLGRLPDRLGGTRFHDLVEDVVLPLSGDVQVRRSQPEPNETATLEYAL